MIGGSNYNILGPAGALVNIISTLVVANGIKIVPLVAIVSGVMEAIVYALKLEKFCAVIPLSVLEGFSMGVAIVIGCGQLNNAFGLTITKRHQEFHENIWETIVHLGETKLNEFLPFLFFFSTLMYLAKYKAGKPWIILIAVLGIIYGYATYSFESIRPVLLRDKYPTMV
jgi:SulP family sulfate permease